MAGIHGGKHHESILRTFIKITLTYEFKVDKKKAQFVICLLWNKITKEEALIEAMQSRFYNPSRIDSRQRVLIL